MRIGVIAVIKNNLIRFNGADFSIALSVYQPLALKLYCPLPRIDRQKKVW